LYTTPRAHPYALPPCILAALALPLFAVASAVLLPPEVERETMRCKQERQQRYEEKEDSGTDSAPHSQGTQGTGRYGSVTDKAVTDRGGGGGGGIVRADVALLALMSGLLAAATLAFDELWTLLLVTDVSRGGLNLDTRTISVSFMLGRVSMMACQLMVWPRVERKYGALTSHRVAVVAMAAFYAAFPLVPSSAVRVGGVGLGVAALWAMLACQYSLETVSRTSLFLLVTRWGRGRGG
jgi:hypothetical protein